MSAPLTKRCARELRSIWPGPVAAGPVAVAQEDDFVDVVRDGLAGSRRTGWRSGPPRSSPVVDPDLGCAMRAHDEAIFHLACWAAANRVPCRAAVGQGST